MRPMRDTTRVLLVIAVAATLSTSKADAAERQRVAIKEVKGKNAGFLEAAISKALEEYGGVEVIASKEYGKISQRVARDIARAAKELAAAAVIDASWTKSGKDIKAVIRLLAGSTGKVVKTWTPKAKDQELLTNLIERSLWLELGPSIKAQRTPGERRSPGLAQGEVESPKPRADPIVKIPPAPSEPIAGGSGRETASSGFESPDRAPLGATTAVAVAGRLRSKSPLGLGLDVSFFTRKLTYNDDIFRKLRPYTLGLAPAPRLTAWWHPGAHFTDGLISVFGVGLSLSLPLGLSSTDTSETEYPTRSVMVEGSLRGRIPLGAHEVVVLAGLGNHTYAIETKGQSDPGVPDVSYTYLRLGAQGRFQILEGFNASATVAFRPLLSAGEISSSKWFGRATAAGLDAGVALAYEVLSGLDVVIKGELLRYFFSMHPQPNDPWIAGGAVDQYFAGSIGAAWHL